MSQTINIHASALFFVINLLLVAFFLNEVFFSLCMPLFFSPCLALEEKKNPRKYRISVCVKKKFLEGVIGVAVHPFV